jgi:uncharacterized membrane protein YiaA
MMFFGANLIAFFIGLIVFVIGMRMGKEKEWEEGGWIALVIIGGIATIITLCTILFETGLNFFIAYKYPLMWTIEQIIK